MNRMSERETEVELPWAADSCPCVEKQRTVLPLTVWSQRQCGAVYCGGHYCARWRRRLRLHDAEPRRVW
jgi:hypothetical protein